jgi:cell division protein FtsW
MMARSKRPSAGRPARIGSVNALERGLIAATVTLCAVGVFAVGSAAAPQAAADGSSIWIFMVRDLGYLFIGLVAFLLACRFPAARLSRLAVPALVAAGALLVAVHLVGTAASGGRRWLAVGSFSFQPSELFTLAACCFLAHAIARGERTKREWGELLVVVVPVVLGAAVILAEPDMGTSSVLLIVTLLVLIVAGMPGRLTATLTATLATAAVIFAMSSSYRRERILSFLHPGKDSAGAGYQLLQSKICLGAGHVTGLGYGGGRCKWGLLPNPHTDFIFATIGEELGYIGAVVVLALFAWLVALGMRAARRAPDRESQLLAAAITSWFGVEALINIASVVGWWPVTGIPLPFVSYGGTSLMIDLAAAGLLVNVARRTTLARRANPRTVHRLAEPARQTVPAPARERRRGA